ncbi:cysteine hydrolase family protein [Kistimonas asteriae]|uniref:cysteine hydrolase family protein n=1 Tax=Kistimonas asteriae TaxID=517724 RepID=UPI001BA61907|nr:cysteine hydrolase [Kistimonas asteriae]
MFAESGNFYCAGLQAIVPVIAKITCCKMQSTVFTRFIPPQPNKSTASQWQAHYHQWLAEDFGQLSPEQYDLITPLDQLSQPDKVIEKNTYSVFESPAFQAILNQQRPDTLIFSGVKTNYCVLASVLASVDHDYRTIVVTDAVAGSSDQTQHAVLDTLLPRFIHQVELVTADTLLQHWHYG